MIINNFFNNYRLMGVEKTAWQKFKPYILSIVFPIISSSLIYADYRHTKLWKQSVTEKENQKQLA